MGYDKTGYQVQTYKPDEVLTTRRAQGHDKDELGGGFDDLDRDKGKKHGTDDDEGYKTTSFRSGSDGVRFRS